MSAERDAIDDARLLIPDRKVYRQALRHLSYYEPRPLKVRALARAIHNRQGRPMNPSTVWRSLQRLLQFGYLEATGKQGRRSTYLLCAELRPQLADSPSEATKTAA
jgi:hypothetical protein